MTSFIIYSDGAARGNPGPAGAGATISDTNGNIVEKVCKYLGETTNNQAEYQALELALIKAIEMGATKVSIFADSELMVKQIRKEYKVKNTGLKPIYNRICELLGKIEEFEINHVPRAKNKDADELANIAIDSHNS